MMHVDLILLHPPSIYKFRELPIFYGPISDVIPSSSIFENYPIGFLTMSEYLNRHGISVRIVNLAMKMLLDASFDPESFIAKVRSPPPSASTSTGFPMWTAVSAWLKWSKGITPRYRSSSAAFPRPIIHQEIMRDYPFVDFVVCGDSTEEPLRLLMEAIKSGGDYGTVPNLVWRDERGESHGERHFLPPHQSRLRELRLLPLPENDHEIPRPVGISPLPELAGKPGHGGLFLPGMLP